MPASGACLVSSVPNTGKKRCLVKSGYLDIIFRSICAAEGWTLIESQIMPNHVHLFISSKPQASVIEMVKN